MIDLELDGGLALVTLDAPQKRNALGPEDLEELGRAYDEAGKAGVRALVLCGRGPGFCAGRDVSAVDPASDDVPGYLTEKVEPLLQKMASFPAPTFAAVQGACMGVGLGLAIATDVVYVAESARVGSPFARLGAVLDSGGHALFTDRLGAHRTLDLVYTGEPMTGADAVAAGLFSRVLPDEDLLSFTLATARKTAQGPTAAFLASKALVAEIRDHRMGLWESMAHESVEQDLLSSTADYAEGFRAFQEKRSPQFIGH